MALTRPTGEQLRFRSALTGDHILDVYLEAAEIGGRTLTDLLQDVYDPANGGKLRSNIFQFRVKTGSLQNRSGDFIDPEAGWVSITNFFKWRGAYANATTYNHLDMVQAGDVVYLYTNATSASFASQANFIASADTVAFVNETNFIAYRDAAQAAQVAAEAARDTANTHKTGAETAKTGSETARNASQTAQTASETARNASQTAQGLSEAARDAAQTAQTAAETARNKAQDWADLAEDSIVESGKYSAKHHAAKSAASAAQAAADVATTEGLALALAIALG